MNRFWMVLSPTSQCTQCWAFLYSFLERTTLYGHEVKIGLHVSVPNRGCVNFCMHGLFSAKEFGLQQIGSFRCLNGKLDLTTFEAEHTLRYWKDELERLRKEMSVRTIAKEISAATVPYTIRVLAYKNGDGKRRPGELIIGSSISGVSNVNMDMRRQDRGLSGFKQG